MQEFVAATMLDNPVTWIFILGGALIGVWLVKKWQSGGADAAAGAPSLFMVGGGAVAGALVSWFVICGIFWIFGGGSSGIHQDETPSAQPGEDLIVVTQVITPTVTVTATMRPTLTPTRARPTATAAPATQTRPAQPTATKPPPTATAVPAATATITPTTTLPPMPNPFNITLTGSGETTCGYPDFTFDYTAAIEGSAMRLTQIVNGIVTTGPFDPETGAFTTSLAGLPGTEIYDGVLSWDGETVSVKGTYTYVDDPNQACEGVWEISGSGGQ